MSPRVWSLIGTARPRPMPARAVLMPTTRPSLVASAPPEFPGFRLASVWITLSIMRSVPPARAGSDRPTADTTPAVTDPANPCGLPIATTSWPTRSVEASPSCAGCRPLLFDADDRQIAERVAAGNREAELAAVGERRPAAARRGRHHVRVRDEPVLGDRDGRPARIPHPANANERGRAGSPPTARPAQPRRSPHGNRRPELRPWAQGSCAAKWHPSADVVDEATQGNHPARGLCGERGGRQTRPTSLARTATGVPP